MMLNGSVSDNDGDNDNGDHIDLHEPASGGSGYGDDSCDGVMMMSLMLMWRW